jgi:hypothetical protein
MTAPAFKLAPVPKMSLHARVLVWKYGAERALLIRLGLDKAANADLAKWRGIA